MALLHILKSIGIRFSNYISTLAGLQIPWITYTVAFFLWFGTFRIVLCHWMLQPPESDARWTLPYAESSIRSMSRPVVVRSSNISNQVSNACHILL